MFDLDTVLLARVQFGFTVAFHILLPSFIIGLASFLAVLEWCWLRTHDRHFRDLYKFWIKIFTLVFGMSVASGVVVSYHLVLYGSAVSGKVANIIEPLLRFAALATFFLEAPFLGVMLFGWGRVSSAMHFVATCIVAGGALLTTFLMLAASSWMQTPQGFAVSTAGLLYPVHWFAIILNPSFLYRFVHMVIASYLATALVIGGVGAHYLLSKTCIRHARIMFEMAVIIVALMAPMQLVVGHMYELNTLKHQPLKVAAMEGIWETEKGAALRVLAWPDQKKGINHYEMKIPNAASLILTHSYDGEVKGLNEWRKEEIPLVWAVFWSFRIMVGMGLLMIVLGVVSAVRYFRRRLFCSRVLFAMWVLMIPAGFIAIASGWFVTEIGRQPYTVYGIIRTLDSFSPVAVGTQVLWLLISFLVLYIVVFLCYLISVTRKGIPEIYNAERSYRHGVEAAIIKSMSLKKEVDL